MSDTPRVDQKDAQNIVWPSSHGKKVRVTGVVIYDATGKTPAQWIRLHRDRFWKQRWRSMAGK